MTEQFSFKVGVGVEGFRHKIAFLVEVPNMADAILNYTFSYIFAFRVFDGIPGIGQMKIQGVICEGM
jgi:hypothetical protein